MKHSTAADSGFAGHVDTIKVAEHKYLQEPNEVCANCGMEITEEYWPCMWVANHQGKWVYFHDSTCHDIWKKHLG